jgi:hypothetical protein
MSMRKRSSVAVAAVATASIATGASAATPKGAVTAQPQGQAAVRFIDVTSSASVGTRPSIGGLASGSSWGDFNGDGRPDLFVGNHYGTPALFKNLGNGSFADVTTTVMTRPATAQPGRWGDQHGAAWSDMDKDGDNDLMVLVGANKGTGKGENQLYINSGSRLVDHAEDYNIQYAESRGRTPLWLDYDNDGQIDLFQGAKARPGGSGPPTLFQHTTTGFKDVRRAVNFLPTNSISGWLSDVDRDGQMEFLYQGAKLLAPAAPFNTRFDILKTQGSQFQNVTHSFIRGSQSDLAVADYDGDLRPDFFLCNAWRPSQHPISNDLYFNRSSGFIRVTGKAAAALNEFPRPCPPSVVAADFDNDMDVDIFIDNGIAEHDQENTILRNRGDGAFVADGHAAGAAGRLKGGADSVAMSDYNGDGFLDLYLTYNGQVSQLYRNQGNNNHWLELSLRGTRSNADGIGAQIYVIAGGKKQLREQNGGIHRYWAQNDSTVHVGLGSNSVAQSVEIRWPSGRVQRLNNVRADQRLRVTEPR